MKKLLLGIAAAAFLFGCASDYELEMGDDPVAELNRALASHQGACADYIFREPRSLMEQYNDLKFNSKRPRKTTDELFVRAQESYRENLMQYNSVMNDVDRVQAEINSQRSRLAAIQRDGLNNVPREYNEGRARIDNLHARAEQSLAQCDAVSAAAYVNEAERELRYLEDLVGNSQGMGYEPVYGGEEVYVVKRGDSLWRIAANKYANPYFWPLIYWDNRASIKDPDLIYPNQHFTIRYNHTDSQKREADHFSRTRGPWSLYDGK